MASMRVFIASPDDRFRLAMMVFVDKEPGLVVAGMSDRLVGLPAQLQGSGPDVLLLDLDLASLLRPDLFADLHILKPRPITVAFATRPETKEPILEAGADYFVSKEAPPDKLIPILNSIMSSKANAGLEWDT